ncbi:MAG TPA: primosomal protein N', partial [Syntrophales bacterium]|nr:primosomal protein N' [Syntrophales bacterium]
LVVGARSALFAPVRDLRLIIVDEEHDNSYKQDERMPYNARDLAVVRARQRGATVILGSATPSIQSYSNALRGKYRHLVLTDRPKGLGLPEVEVLDLRREREEKGKTPLLSRPLVEAIGETLETGKQTLLFLNRRGFHTFLFCADCGYVLKCLNCSVSLTFHAASGILKCHHCDFSVKAPPLCPACKGNRVRSYGAGTERLEAEVAKIFPGARVGRMDSDMAGGRAQQEKTLLALDRGEIDILIGTQMVAKGHDYPNVVLVGVIMADASLNLPDFRAAEYTFQLLTQVSGRGGRGDETGRVIIQTFNPEHYAVRFACGHDYRGFYEEEIVLRKALGYPPFLRLVNVRISGLKKENVEECAREVAEMTRALAKSLAPGESVDIIGPAEAPIPKLKGRYRWQLILKGKSVQSLHGVAQNILSQRRRRGVDVRVDVDPLNFM